MDAGQPANYFVCSGTGLPARLDVEAWRSSRCPSARSCLPSAPAAVHLLQLVAEEFGERPAVSRGPGPPDHVRYAAEGIVDMRWSVDGSKAYAMTRDGMAYILRAAVIQILTR